ncbi:hypothetical protein DFH06DRAFT_1440658 [Mycena polygramma]|nr:hypothetical protein DFH06DRAFT_1440658 [Mycena polygramma]
MQIIGNEGLRAVSEQRAATSGKLLTPEVSCSPSPCPLYAVKASERESGNPMFGLRQYDGPSSPARSQLRLMQGSEWPTFWSSVERRQCPALYRDAAPHDLRFVGRGGATEDEVDAQFGRTANARIGEIAFAFWTNCFRAPHLSTATRLSAMLVLDVLGLFQEFPPFLPVSRYFPRLLSFVRAMALNSGLRRLRAGLPSLLGNG